MLQQIKEHQTTETCWLFLMFCFGYLSFAWIFAKGIKRGTWLKIWRENKLSKQKQIKTVDLMQKLFQKFMAHGNAINNSQFSLLLWHKSQRGPFGGNLCPQNLSLSVLLVFSWLPFLCLILSKLRNNPISVCYKWDKGSIFASVISLSFKNLQNFMKPSCFKLLHEEYINM